MSDPVGPVRRPALPRPVRRKAASGAVTPHVEIVEAHRIEEEPAAGHSPGSGAGAHATFAAQFIGQNQQEPEGPLPEKVAKAVRGAYLGTEYSGKADRRSRKGRFKKTEV